MDVLLSFVVVAVYEARRLGRGAGAGGALWVWKVTGHPVRVAGAVHSCSGTGVSTEKLSLQPGEVKHYLLVSKATVYQCGQVSLNPELTTKPFFLS